MNTIKKGLFAAGLIASSAIATDKASIGLGVNIVDPNGIIVQTRLTPEIKMPVTLGYLSQSDIANEDGDTKTNSRFFIGVAPQFIFASTEQMEASAGLQLGMLMSTEGGSLEGTFEDSDATLALGPVLGIEYYFMKNFAIGGSFALNYSKEFEDKANNNLGSSNLNTQSGVVFSWYFQ